ncbi:MAG TPA: hypothetical protein VGQ12_00805 [Candidatus Angelobacter sp.]|jgi:hydroxylaminobenzene mutase|nr:hypothetical protein [Candidatus Angelobacter sp.]
MEDSRRKLIWHGMFLFLLGLLTGFVETKFANPRMGLAAHLEGVMNGTFLVALGAVWMEVRLPLKLKAAAYWSALYGAYIIGRPPRWERRLAWRRFLLLPAPATTLCTGRRR